MSRSRRDEALKRQALEQGKSTETKPELSPEVKREQERHDLLLLLKDAFEGGNTLEADMLFATFAQVGTGNQILSQQEYDILKKKYSTTKKSHLPPQSTEAKQSKEAKPERTKTSPEIPKHIQGAKKLLIFAKMLKTKARGIVEASLYDTDISQEYRIDAATLYIRAGEMKKTAQGYYRAQSEKKRVELGVRLLEYARYCEGLIPYLVDPDLRSQEHEEDLKIQEEDRKLYAQQLLDELWEETHIKTPNEILDELYNETLWSFDPEKPQEGTLQAGLEKAQETIEQAREEDRIRRYQERRNEERRLREQEEEDLLALWDDVGRPLIAKLSRMTLEEIAAYKPGGAEDIIFDAILKEVDLHKREEKVAERTATLRDQINELFLKAQRHYQELVRRNELTEAEKHDIITTYLIPIDERNRMISRIREEVFSQRPLVYRN